MTPVEKLVIEFGWENDPFFLREYHTNVYVHALVEMLVQERLRQQSGRSQGGNNADS